MEPVTGWRTIGGMTRLLLLFPLLATSACATTESVPPGTGAYRALGTEPGWTVTITDDRIDYDGDYGTTRISVPRPDPRTTFNGHRYETDRLIVDITHSQCNDGMSDRVYADTVLLTADGETLRGCGGEILPPADLAGTNWSIANINGADTGGGAAYSLSFMGDRLSGKAGCNSIAGTYSVSGPTLTAGSLSTTKMACPAPHMDHERQALAILGQPIHLRFQGPETLLLSSSGGTMVLKRAI